MCPRKVYKAIKTLESLSPACRSLDPIDSAPHILRFLKLNITQQALKEREQSNNYIKALVIYIEEKLTLHANLLVQ